MRCWREISQFQDFVLVAWCLQIYDKIMKLFICQDLNRIWDFTPLSSWFFFSFFKICPDFYSDPVAALGNWILQILGIKSRKLISCFYHNQETAAILFRVFFFFKWNIKCLIFSLKTLDSTKKLVFPSTNYYLNLNNL